MEIIDKSHIGIKKAPRYTTESYINFLNTREIYISAGACRELGISPGLFAHFVNDETRWYVYFDTDQDGFAVNSRTKNGQTRDLSLTIFSAPIIRMFIQRSNHELPCAFYLKPQEAKIKGHHLIEILHNRPIEK